MRPVGIRSLELLEELQITLPLTFTTSYNSVPPWTITKPTFITDLSHYKKATTSTSQYKALFREILSKHIDHNYIFTDGSKLGESVGCAFITKKESFTFKLHSMPSVYNSELFAVLQSLLYALANKGSKF
jgi:hypothetical protein